MNPEQAAALERRLRRCLRQARDLTEADQESIGSLIDAGEWEIALDTLCTQLYEYDLEPTPSAREELLLLGAELNVPVAYLLGDPWASRHGGDES